MELIVSHRTIACIVIQQKSRKIPGIRSDNKRDKNFLLFHHELFKMDFGFPVLSREEFILTLHRLFIRANLCFVPLAYYL